jgi:hypothetical protein
MCPQTKIRCGLLDSLVSRFATNSTAYQTLNKYRILVALELYSICNQVANPLSAFRFSKRACLKTMKPSPQSAFPPPLREVTASRLRSLLLGMEAQRHVTGRCEKKGHLLPLCLIPNQKDTIRETFSRRRGRKHRTIVESS